MNHIGLYMAQYLINIYLMVQRFLCLQNICFHYILLDKINNGTASVATEAIATHVLLAFHMLFINILILNLLVAVFT